jgi:cytoplasmic iron level regulating protein YaaA (DUF328/UPF0246 family)
LIACVSKKASNRQTAEKLYLSDLFKKELRYAREIIQPDDIFILSAKHGLVKLSEELDPYDLTLNTMLSKERKAWAEKVLADLKREADFKRDQFVFLAGNKYRQYLLPVLKQYEIPMMGLKIGEQLGWLKEQLESKNER